jgi:hypothetical protein
VPPERDDAAKNAEVHDRVNEQIDDEPGVAGLIAGDQPQHGVTGV